MRSKPGHSSEVMEHHEDHARNCCRPIDEIDEIDDKIPDSIVVTAKFFAVPLAFSETNLALCEWTD